MTKEKVVVKRLEDIVNRVNAYIITYLKTNDLPVQLSVIKLAGPFIQCKVHQDSYNSNKGMLNATFDELREEKHVVAEFDYQNDYYVFRFVAIGSGEEV